MTSPLVLYRSFLLQNAAQISSVEQALRSLSYFLPGRFADADLASETLFSVVNLVSLYHDRILYDAVQQADMPHYKPTLINQYHHFWQNKSKLIHWTSLALTVIQTLESSCEMMAKKSTGNRPTERRRWNLVVFIEAIKVILRLILVNQTQRVSLTPAFPQRDVDPELVATAMAINGTTHSSYKGSRTGMKLPNIDVMGKGMDQVWDQYLSLKTIRTAFRSPIDLLSQLKGSRSYGEIMFIVRPLIYAFLLRKYGRQSWLPFFTSLLIELVSYILVTRIPKFNSHKISKLEQGEFDRRAYSFLWYLLRGPTYAKFTKHFLNTICSAMDNKPILKLFSGIIHTYQPLWEDVYFYTSGS